MAWVESFLAPAVYAQSEPPNAADVEFFEKRIRPILTEHCYECHSVSKTSGGLRLDSRSEILKGGDSGTAVQLEQPDASLLLQAVRYNNSSLQMPPKGRLQSEQIATLESWVQRGLPDPRPEELTSGNETKGMSIEEGKSFWSFQSLGEISIPDVEEDTWSRTFIDSFLLEELRANRWKPAGEASKAQWIRRVYLDLIGLPPSFEQVSQFEQEDAPDSFERVVDELLNSPQYGVRWGRHWLDIVRYADSNGLDENLALGSAWRYRDYVVDSWNRNKRFDRFVQEQIAGDLLENASRDSHMGTGFLVLGAKVLAEPDREKLSADTIDEQIDALGKSFLGLTLGCVRCHDHKFDPLLQSDYYALAAIFRSTRTFADTNTGAIKHWNEVSFADEQERFELKKVNDELAAKQAAMNKAKSQAMEQMRKATREKVLEYLEAAMQLAPDCSLVDCESIAKTYGIHPRVLLHCRTYLTRFADSKLFSHWTACYAVRDIPSMRAHYKRLFDSSETVVPSGDGTASASSYPVDSELRKLAQAALKDATGFLAIPAKPEHALSDTQIAEYHRLAYEARVFESVAPDESTFMGVSEGRVVESMPIHIRGNHLHHGKRVHRGFPTVLVATRGNAIFDRHQSGRLELARWLTDSTNPLVARVMVNRLWRWHFGKGIVRTTENFGVLGDRPSHPKLLDFLAREFIESGWSMKELQRSIVLSSAYRMANHHPEHPSYAAIDPDNAKLWRFPLVRLDAEQIRDSILHVTGTLDYRLGGKTVPLRNRQFVFDHTSIDHTRYETARRTAYFPIIRNNLAPLLQQFDFPDPTAPTGDRATTSVAPQSLLLMNAPWIHEASQSLVRQMLQDASSRTDRSSYLFKQVLGRLPSDAESRAVLKFVDEAAIDDDSNPGGDPIAIAWSLVVHNLLIGNEFLFAR